MGDETHYPKSFSRWKRWGFGLNLVIRTALVLAVVVMVNYLSRECYLRFQVIRRFPVKIHVFASMFGAGVHPPRTGLRAGRLHLGCGHSQL